MGLAAIGTVMLQFAAYLTFLHLYHPTQKMRNASYKHSQWYSMDVSCSETAADTKKCPGVGMLLLFLRNYCLIFVLTNLASLANPRP